MAGTRQRWLEQLSRFALDVARQTGLPSVRKLVVQQVREACDADGATLFLLDGESGALVFDRVDGESAHQLEERRIPPGEGIAGRVALERLPLLVADARADRHFASGFDAASGFATGAIIAVPLELEERLLGVLEAVRRQGREPFTQEELDRLSAMAPMVAAAVHHLCTEASLREAHQRLKRSHEELERRVVERTRLIARAKQEWEATFDAMQDPIVVLDGYLVRRANRGFQTLAGGRPWSELINAPCHEVLAGRKTPCPGCPLSAPGRATEVRFGDSVFQVTTADIGPGGGSGRVVHYRDVTQQKRLAERLSESERLASVGQLASGAAHEINNPLSFVLANLRMLRDTVADVLVPATRAREVALEAAARGDLERVSEALLGAPVDPAEVADALEIIDEALVGAQRIHEVVRSLRELSRQEQGRLEVVSINALVERAAARALGRNHHARLELESRAAVSVVPQQLERALENVVRNARQAVLTDGDIVLRTRDDERGVVVEIEDRGCGIPAEHLPHVFDPFFTTRRVGEGMGLGLTVTWGIVKRLGGTVELSSEVGVGTTVRLVLPPGDGAPPWPVVDNGHRLGRYGERRRASGLFRVEAP
jgi:two-component system NtrC family sensor kinase